MGEMLITSWVVRKNVWKIAEICHYEKLFRIVTDEDVLFNIWQDIIKAYVELVSKF